MARKLSAWGWASEGVEHCTHDHYYQLRLFSLKGYFVRGYFVRGYFVSGYFVLGYFVQGYFVLRLFYPETILSEAILSEAILSNMLEIRCLIPVHKRQRLTLGIFRSTHRSFRLTYFIKVFEGCTCLG